MRRSTTSRKTLSTDGLSSFGHDTTALHASPDLYPTTRRTCAGCISRRALRSCKDGTTPACRTICQTAHAWQNRDCTDAEPQSQPLLLCRLRRGIETQKIEGDTNKSFAFEVGTGVECNVAFVREIAPSGRPDCSEA